MSTLTKLNGPILVFGAGGFIGFHMLLTLLAERNDVVGVFSNPGSNWRLKAHPLAGDHIATANITDEAQLKAVLTQVRPQTIFNLAAFGAYSHQADYQKIYHTNFISTVNSVEFAKPLPFTAYVYAGTSSEYGTNSERPRESDPLFPNSHYAVSKTAVAMALTYYGKTENLPVAHLRLYSAYGPWEEPTRLIPRMVVQAIKGGYPPLVNPSISRDFVYVDDVVDSFVETAYTLQQKKLYGEILNVATGTKTTIQTLALRMRKLCRIPTAPRFSGMQNRSWDLTEWYGNTRKTQRLLGWKAKTNLSKGLEKTIQWHQKNNLWHA